MNIYLAHNVLSEMSNDENAAIKYRLARARVILSDLALRHPPCSPKQYALQDISQTISDIIDELDDETDRRLIENHEREMRENSSPLERK